VRKSGKEFEAHLMVERPERWAPPLFAKGFKRAIVHIETISPVGFRDLAARARKSRAVLIAAINPGTPLRRILPYLPSAAGVCVLGVEPGRNGAPYDPRTPSRVRAIARRRCPVQVDGGMTPRTVGAVVRAGASRINSGSYASSYICPATYSSPQNSVYMATFDAGGSVGSWTTLTSVPINDGGYAVGHQKLAITNNRLYVIGGFCDNYNYSCSQTGFNSASVNADGTINPWFTLTSFGSTYAGGFFALGGRLYANQGPNGAGVNILPLNSGSLTQYYAERAADSGFTTGLANSGWMYGDNWSFGGLASNTTYYVHVKARNTDLAETVFTNLGSTLTISLPPVLAAPTASTDTYLDAGSSNITLLWDRNGNPGGEVNGAYWGAATALPQTMSGGALVMAGGWAWHLGGSNGTSNQSTVYYSRVNADGTLGAWDTRSALPSGTALPNAISGLGAAVSGGRVYAVGYDGSEATASAYMAAWNTDGTLSAWTKLTALPASKQGHGFVIYRGRLYAAGGSNGTSAQSTTYSASIQAGGTLGAWRAETSLPGPRQYLSLTAFGGYLYLIGGSDGSSAYGTVYRSPVASDGSLGAWEALASMPEARFSASAVINEGWLYVLGGDSGSGVQNTIFRSSFTPLGALGAWQTTDPLPAARRSQAAAVYNGQLYVAGGQDSGGVTQSPVYRLARFEGPQYYAERAADAGFSVSVAGTGWMSSVTGDFPGLASNSLYYFRAKARNTDGIETAFFGLGSTRTAVTPAAVLSSAPAPGTRSTVIVSAEADSTAVTLAMISGRDSMGQSPMDGALSRRDSRDSFTAPPPWDFSLSAAFIASLSLPCWCLLSQREKISCSLNHRFSRS